MTILLPFILVAVSRSMKISLHVQLNAMIWPTLINQL